jgi:hypothetical protein
MPTKVRQTNFRRWHNRLFLGYDLPVTDAIAMEDENQQFAPYCPYDDNHRDSPQHFTHHCQLARCAQAYLRLCWKAWHVQTTQEEYRQWLKKEWSPHNGWNLAFVCLTHALYAGRMMRMDEKRTYASLWEILIAVLSLFRLTGDGAWTTDLAC